MLSRSSTVLNPSLKTDSIDAKESWQRVRVGLFRVDASWCRTHHTEIEQLRGSAFQAGTTAAIGYGVEEMERVAGIEPALSAWEAEVLPLNYTRWRA
jgi:hypothetical protein